MKRPGGSAKVEQLKKGSAVAFDDEQQDEEVGMVLGGATMSERRQQAIARAKTVFGNKKVKTAIWNHLDSNGNGTIDHDEIMALFGKLGFKPDATRLQMLLQKVDNNANGSLEFAEFCEFLRLAKDNEMDSELMSLALMSTPDVMVEAARWVWFEVP